MDRGFTLIEMIITLVVISILGVFTFSFLISSTNTYLLMRNQWTAHREGAYVVERISRELRDATAVSALNPLSFQMAHPTPMDPNTSIQYRLSGTRLFRGTRPGAGGYTERLMGTNVGSFTVTGLANSCYGISLSEVGGTVTYSTAVSLKNVVTRFGGNYQDTVR